MNLLDLLEVIDYRPYWNKNHCLRHLSAKSTCRKCEQVCSKKNLLIDQDRLMIHDGCDSCGSCGEHCPAKALHTVKRDYFIQGETLFVTFDDRLKFQHNSMFFANVHYFSLDTVSYFYLRGIRQIILVGKRSAPAMQAKFRILNRYLSMIKKNLIQFEKWSLSDWDNNKKRVMKLMDTPCSRRQMFQNCSRSATSLFQQFCGFRTQKSSHRYQLLIDYNPFPYKTPGLCTVILDSSLCVSCSACEYLCPQNAWSKVNNEMLHRSEACTACGLCQEVCPEKAILIKSKLSWK